MNFNHDSGSISSILTIDTAVAPPLGGSNTLQVVGTGGIVFPAGTTAQQPTGVPAGTQRWNTTISKMEVFNGTIWTSDSGGSVTSIAVDTTLTNIGTAETPNYVLSVNGGGTATITTDGTFTLDLAGELKNFANISASADGAVVRLTDGTYVSRDFVAASGSAILIENGDGLLGNPTFSLDPLLEAVADITNTGFLYVDGNLDTARVKTFASAGDITISDSGDVITIGYTASGALAGLDAVSGNGIIVQTAEDTYTNRSIEGTADNIVVTNGDAVAGNPTINLAAVTQAATGNFVKVTLDGFGRVTGNTAVTTADITSLVDSTYINAAGDMMTGNLAMGNNVITGVGAPVGGTDATNKNYVDALVSGLSWKQAVKAASTDNIDLATGGLLTLDNVTLQAGDRVLVKNQTLPAENGIYIVAAGAWLRSTDMDDAAEFSSATVYVQQGQTQSDSGWTQTAEVVALGTDAVTWNQFTGAGTFVAGVGLDLTGNTFNVNLGAGIAQLPSDEVGVDIRTNSALFLTVDGDTVSTATGAQLALRTGTGISQDSANGLYIAAGDIDNTLLTNSTITVTGTAGSDAVALGESLAVIGGSTPISTAVDSATNTLTISVADATTATKGLASFAAADFAVTSGEVTVVAKGIDSLTDVDTTTVAPTTGQLLSWNGTNWVPTSNITVVELAELTDISLTNLADDQFLQYNSTSGKWENVNLSIQSSDAGLASLVGLTTMGIVVQADPSGDLFETRTLVAGTGISITNANGVDGDITIDNTGVTSVGLALPSIFTVSNSPVTTTGDLTATLATQAANLVFAGPASTPDAAPTFRSLVYADLPIKLYVENRSSEVAPTATGANAIALGSAATASRIGELAHASGQFAASGDAQSIELVLRNTTTDATVTDLFLDGASARAVLDDNSALTFTVQIIGTTAGGTEIGGYRFDGVMKRGTGAASVAFSGTPSKNILGENVAAWDAAVVADTTNGALAVRVTGEAAKTIRWVATVRATQVKF